jgi:hypothetical protein
MEKTDTRKLSTEGKPLYGKQEGAVVSYNPKKPGRPSHSYHSYFMANTRMALGVEVEAGDKHTGKHVSVGLWKLLDNIPRELWPVFRATIICS